LKKIKIGASDKFQEKKKWLGLPKKKGLEGEARQGSLCPAVPGTAGRTLGNLSGGIQKRKMVNETAKLNKGIVREDKS